MEGRTQKVKVEDLSGVLLDPLVVALQKLVHALNSAQRAILACACAGVSTRPELWLQGLACSSRVPETEAAAKASTRSAAICTVPAVGAENWLTTASQAPLRPSASRKPEASARPGRVVWCGLRESLPLNGSPRNFGTVANTGEVREYLHLLGPDNGRWWPK